MGELGRDPDLLEEPLAEGGGQLRVEHLERDRAIVAEVVGAIDRRHPAPAERALDAVAVGEGGLEIGGAVGQRHAAEGVSRMLQGCSRDGQRTLA